MGQLDDRARQPAPECCRRCANFAEWKLNGVERHECLSGHPMHPNCGWHKPSNESLVADRNRT